jgi:hypothetical protein
MNTGSWRRKQRNTNLNNLFIFVFALWSYRENIVKKEVQNFIRKVNGTDHLVDRDLDLNFIAMWILKNLVCGIPVGASINDTLDSP